MKKTNIIYWIFTGLMVAVLGFGSVYNAVSAPEAVAYVTRLGYPAYLVPFLGVAKLLGLIAVLMPGYSRLKEWAYAGLVFDLIGALYSHIGAGDPPANWAPLIVFIGVVFGSYIYYHKRQKNATETMPRLSLAGE